MTAITLAEVAARAGVSAMTASRALAAPAKVAPATRARIEAAVRELHYVPNLIAGGLATARTRAVAVLVPTIANSIFADTVEGVSAVLEPRGYAVLLAQSGYDPAREEKALLALLSRRPEALVMVGSPGTKDAAALLKRTGVRVVEAWILPRRPIDAAVGFDNRAVGAAVANRLVAGGRRRLAFLGGSDVRSDLRFQGFRQACRRSGLPAPCRVTAPVWGSPDAAAAVAGGLGDADAVFTSTDAYAIGVLSALREMRRGVPHDVAVFGLGDLEIGRHAVPRLSTVRIDGRRIGEMAAELALAPERGRVIDLGFELIERETA